MIFIISNFSFRSTLLAFCVIAISLTCPVKCGKATQSVTALDKEIARSETINIPLALEKKN